MNRFPKPQSRKVPTLVVRRGIPKFFRKPVKAEFKMINCLNKGTCVLIPA